MRRRQRIALYAGAGVAAVLLLLLAAILILTNTDWGREQVRGFAENQLDGATDGTVQLGRFEGNLLRRVTVAGVRIEDEQGRPFISADTVSTRFSLRGLIRQQIRLTDVRIVSATVVLDEPPGEDWNYIRIFRIDPEPDPDPDPTVGWGDWVSLHNVGLVDVRIEVRSAWAPPEDVTGEERRRAIERALGGETRDNIVAVEGGYQNIVELRRIDATLPVLIPAHPDSAGIPIEISRFTGIVQPWRPPEARVAALAGKFNLERDTLHFSDVRAELAESRLAAAGFYSLKSGNLFLRINGTPFAFNDMRWLTPQLPEEGGGPVRLTVATQPTATRIVAEDMDFVVGDARLAGHADVTTGDTLRLGNTSVRFSRVGTELLNRLAGVEFPRTGEFTGQLAVAGTVHNLAIDGDVTFDDAAGPASRVVADGSLALEPSLRFGAMALEFRPLHAQLVRGFVPAFPAAGVITGYANLTGTTDLLQLRSDLTLDEPGIGRSRVAATGRIDQRAELRLDNVDLRLDPLRTDLLRAAAPELPRGGTIVGRVRLDGVPQRALQLDGAVAVNDPATGTSTIGARGGLEFDPFRLRSMFVRVEPLQADLVREWLPQLPPGSTLAGEARLDGMPARELAVDGDLELRDPQTGVSEFGATGRIAFGDELRFTDMTLRLQSVQLDLLRREAPDLPPGGLVAGTLRLDGVPQRMLDVDGNLTHVDDRLGTSRFALSGGIGLTDPVRFRGLDVRMDPLQMALVHGFAPDLPLGGVIAGHARLDGSTERLGVSGNVVHNEAGERSHVVGSVEFATGPRGWAMADLTLQPLSLQTVGRFVPAAALHGSVAGSLQARGRLDDLTLDADLRVAGGGSIALSGWMDLAADQPGYDLRARTTDFDMAAVTAAAPAVSSLTGRIALTGRGTDPATMNASVAADLVDLAVDDVAADRVLANLDIRAGLATVDTLFLRLGTAEATATGSFGLAAGRFGELAYTVRADSLHAFAGAFPGTRRGVEPAPDMPLLAADTMVVDTSAFILSPDDRTPPAPGTQPTFAGGTREVHTLTVADISPVIRSPEGLQADPVTGALPAAYEPGLELPETARAGEAARAIAEADARAAADARDPPADSIAGRMVAEGVLRGNIQQFDATGTAEVENLVVAGVRVDDGMLEYAMRDVLTPVADVDVDAEARGVRGLGFAFDSLAVDGSYRGAREGSGRAVIAAYTDDDTDLRADFEFSLALQRSEFRLADATLRFDTVTWTTAQPGVIAWAEGDIEVRNLALRSTAGGSILADGVLPATGAGNLALSIEALEVAQLSALLQLDDDIRGLLDLDVTVTGTQAAPVIAGDAAFREGGRNGANLPDIEATVRYAGLSMSAQARMLHDGLVLGTAEAELPMDLSLTGAGPRLLDGPIAVDIRADSIPASVLPAITDDIEDVRGRIVGDVSIRGTFADPVLDGVVALDLGAARVVPLGVHFDEIAGTFRLDGTTVVVDSLVAWSGGPARITGEIVLQDLGNPVFDLVLVAQNSRIINTDDASLRVDADVTITGPLLALEVTGDVHARSGVIYVPELEELGGTNVVNLDDPGTFDRTGGALDNLRPRTDERPEILQNAVLDLGITVDRDVWVRSTEANVEIYTAPEIGPLQVRSNGLGGGLVVEGSINTDRGEYEFMGRRFRMTRGAITFVGETPINPIFQIAAEHDVRLPGREALQIRIVIGGTADDIQINLESNAQPPISQTDLLSYLAFGRDASSLLQQQGSGLSGQAGVAGELVGNIAGLATQQLATIAMEAGVSEIEREVAREFGLDMFRISPADLPSEVFTGGSADIIRGTEIEAGRYISPRLFLAAQARGGRPGLRLEYRTPGGYEWHAAWQPRYLPLDPTLLDAAPRRTGVLGSFLFREWRF